MGTKEWTCILEGLLRVLRSPSNDRATRSPPVEIRPNHLLGHELEGREVPERGGQRHQRSDLGSVLRKGNSPTDRGGPPGFPNLEGRSPERLHRDLGEDLRRRPGLNRLPARVPRQSVRDEHS